MMATTDRLRVIQFIPHLLWGGGARLAVHIATHTDQAAFEPLIVSLFDYAGDADVEQEIADSGVPIQRLNKKSGFDPGISGQIDAVIRTFRPQVVHTHGYLLLYVLPSCLLHRVPVRVHTMHNLAEKESWGFRRTLNRFLYGRWVTAVSIAPAVTQSMVDFYGLRDVPEIANGIPLDRYRPSALQRQNWRAAEGFAADDFLLTCVAVIRPQKNHALLLRAFAQLARDFPKLHLLLVGGGEQPLESSLRDQTEALGLNARVHFLGQRDDVPAILGASDAFTLASDWEGNPLSVMEAMTAGLPFVGTAVGGIPQLVADNQTGLLVAAGDESALVAALRRVITEPETRQRLGAAAAAYADQHFSVEAMARQYEQLYRRLYKG